MTRATRLQKLSESCWYDRSWLSLVLLPLSWLFSLLAAARRAAYAKGWLTVVDAGLPVIVVGNITAGGAGKTPVVAWLAEQLSAHGYHPGIVSRGYGGSASSAGALVAVTSDVAVCGDEPLLLARITGCPVAVGADRVAAIEMLKLQGVDVVIADDGLQHYRMHRDVEVAVVDGERLFGNGRRLPAGPMRESVQRLQSVDITLVNGGSSELGYRFDLVIDAAVSLDGSVTRSLHEFSGQKVWGVAGIGNPERFYGALRSLNVKVCGVAVADHGTVDLNALLEQEDLPVLMTEKDAVKYPGAATGDIWVVPAKLEMPHQNVAEVLNKVLSRLRVRA